MSKTPRTGWIIVRDPARPQWPGVLLVLGHGRIAVEDGEPTNFQDSNRLAIRLRNALSEEAAHGSE